MSEKENRSGIYLLPNLLTTASLFAAFYSLVASFKGLYEVAVIAIFIGLVADALDGRIARLTNTQTAFGAEYDSLSDLATFGIAPALLLYGFGLQELGKFGWLVAFIYTAAVALRLARFNTQVETADKAYFQGLPCPAGAAVVSSFSWVCQQQEWTHWSGLVMATSLMLIMALLMVSNVRYYSFKALDVKGHVPFLYILLIVVLFVAIAANPAIALFIGSSLYALSGPVQLFWFLRRVRRARRRKD